MKVCETEMLFTFLIHFLSIYTCSFNPYAALFGVITIVLPHAMTFAYRLPTKDESGEDDNPKRKWAILGCKVANVGLVLNMFFLMFGSKFYFDIASDLEKYTS